MFFNDTYKIKGFNIDESDLAWDADRQENFVNPQGYEKIAWQNITDEHFMVWMRSAGLGKFKKLWGRIHETIPVGQYTLSIENSIIAFLVQIIMLVHLMVGNPFL